MTDLMAVFVTKSILKSCKTPEERKFAITKIIQDYDADMDIGGKTLDPIIIRFFDSNEYPTKRNAKFFVDDMGQAYVDINADYLSMKHKANETQIARDILSITECIFDQQIGDILDFQDATTEKLETDRQKEIDNTIGGSNAYYQILDKFYKYQNYFTPTSAKNITNIMLDTTKLPKELFDAYFKKYDIDLQGNELKDKIGKYQLYYCFKKVDDNKIMQTMLEIRPFAIVPLYNFHKNFASEQEMDEVLQTLKNDLKQPCFMQGTTASAEETQVAINLLINKYEKENRIAKECADKNTQTPLEKHNDIDSDNEMTMDKK